MINILKRKHYISNFALILIFILLAINVAQITLKQVNKNKYVYVDMYGSTGVSEKCYYDTKTRDLRCLIPVKVQQYTEE
jgi:hypothetical protein